MRPGNDGVTPQNVPFDCNLNPYRLKKKFGKEEDSSKETVERMGDSSCAAADGETVQWQFHMFREELDKSPS